MATVTARSNEPAAKGSAVVMAENVEALAGDGGAQLAGPAADVQHQATERQQFFHQPGALIEVVLGDVAWKDVVIFVGDGGVQGVLALLGVSEHAARQQDRDVMLTIEDAPTAGAVQRDAGQ